MGPAQRNLFQIEGPYLRFVVHLHQTTRLHYDLRLELDGKLLSWAVPKGPSLEPGVRRLALLQKDHSLSGLTMEGYIPPGAYGGGSILLWDRGEYEPEGRREFSHEYLIHEGLERGLLRFRLYGEKLGGGWTLRRMKEREWLLEKVDDAFASTMDILQFNRSVLSGRTLEDLLTPPPPAPARYVLRVEIDRFYANATGDESPLVVVRDGTVLDASLAARSYGVRVGMTARDAGNLIPGIRVYHWSQEAFEAPQRAWLDECVAFSDAIEPDDQHAAFLDLSQHPQPVDIADRVVAAIQKETGLPVRFGAGPSKWIATLAAEHLFPKADEWERAVKDPRGFLAPLSIQELRAVLPATRDRLQFLGYRTIGEVAALDRGVLYRQFGDEALTIYQAANGVLSDPVTPIYPPNSVAERILFPDPVDSLEVLDANFRRLSQRVGSTLNRKGLEGSNLELSREEETGWISQVREFARPIRCPQTALTGIRAISQAKPPTSPVLGVRVRLQNLRRVESYQPVIIGRGSSDSLAVPLSRALSQLQTTFGETSVRRASEVPIERRIRVLREWQNALGWR